MFDVVYDLLSSILAAIGVLFLLGLVCYAIGFFFHILHEARCKINHDLLKIQNEVERKLLEDKEKYFESKLKERSKKERALMQEFNSRSFVRKHLQIGKKKWNRK